MLPAGDKVEKEVEQFRLNLVTRRQYHQKLKTQSSTPEDVRNYRPKHVALIEITNKLLLLHLVGCLYHCIGGRMTKVSGSGRIFSTKYYRILRLLLKKNIKRHALKPDAGVHKAAHNRFHLSNEELYKKGISPFVRL